MTTSWFENDFPYASSYFSVRLFSDDTSLTASGNDLDNLINEINNHLIDIFDWFCCNRLTLNLTKNKCVIFQSQQRVNYILYSPLVLAGQILQKPQSLKYLSVYIDSHLCWNDYIDYLCCNISKNLNIITRLECYLMSNFLVSVY